MGAAPRTRTPISQAIAEGILTRAELRQLMKRSNRLPAMHLAIWIAVASGTGTLIAVTFDSWLRWPAMFLHGVVLVHHFSIQHECTHYTAFRTRPVNDIVGAICGLIIGLAPRFFRYEHCDHHTWTQVAGRDPEQIPLPKSMGGYLWYMTAVPYWTTKARELSRHVVGRLTDAERKFVPREEHRTVILESRIMVAAYVGVVAVAVWLQWSAPIWYWALPVLMGEPVMRAIRMTEHVGRQPIDDMRLNTRTNLVSKPLQMLCWNMNFHAEHHYAASVPYHALPALHRRLVGHLVVEPRGYLGAHTDMVLQIRGRRPRSDSEDPR